MPTDEYKILQRLAPQSPDWSEKLNDRMTKWGWYYKDQYGYYPWQEEPPWKRDLGYPKNYDPTNPRKGSQFAKKRADAMVTWGTFTIGGPYSGKDLLDGIASKVDVALEAAQFLVECAVFTVFIYEEATQIVARLTLNGLCGRNMSALMVHCYLDLEFVAAMAAGSYEHFKDIFFYCKSGYRAYFAAVFILIEVAHIILAQERLSWDIS